MLGAVGVAGAVLVAGCGGPAASVGVTRVDGVLEVRAKDCGGGDLARVDLVDPRAPDDPVWSARSTSTATADRRVPVVAEVPGYVVADARGRAFGGQEVRVLTEGTDGESWGGPRVVPDEVVEGTLRVAGQDVDLAEWESEPARCPRVTVLSALAGGAATAVAAGALWLAVRAGARLVRRPPPPGSPSEGDSLAIR